jgi:MYXO-CTERM domain-containing protein
VRVTLSDAIGSAGVAILMLAFALTSFGRLSPEARSYHALNVIGAALACTASLRIGFVPFVVLEALWTLVALVALLRGRRREPAPCT